LELTRKFLGREQKPVSAKVVRNVIFSGARLLLLAPLPFFVIPFFLKKLGTSGYGTWAVFLAISGVTSLADLGLATALSKHVASFYAVKDFRSLNRVINTGFALYLAIACLIAGALWVASHQLIATLFRGSPIPPGELEILWRYIILIVIANVLTLLMSSVVLGLQRMDLSNSLTTFNIMYNGGVSVLFLSWNWGLRGILYAYMSGAWITLILNVCLLIYLLPEVKPNLLECRWATAKEILGFSVKTYITQIAVVIHNQIEKIYLARFVGVAFVGFYEIPSDLAIKLRAIPSLILSPIMPAAAELHAQDDKARLESLYYHAHKYLAFIGVPFVVYIVFVSKRFVDLWVGPSLGVIAIPLCALLIVNYFNLVSGPGLLILVAKGDLKPGLYSALVGMALNLSTSLFLIKAYGLKGAVIGTSVSLGAGTGFFLYLFQKQNGGAFWKLMWRAYLKPVICSLTVVAGLWLLTRSEPSSWFGLAMHGIIFGVIYFVLLLLLRFFDRFDLEIVERFLPVSQKARRLVADA
jgi:O-antigen/teichoic acid export membrane protein